MGVRTRFPGVTPPPFWDFQNPLSPVGIPKNQTHFLARLLPVYSSARFASVDCTVCLFYPQKGAPYITVYMNTINTSDRSKEAGPIEPREARCLISVHVFGHFP